MNKLFSPAGLAPCITCVQYLGGVQYRGNIMINVGDILSNKGVFSTMGDIMSAVGVIFSAVGDTQYHEGIS